MEQNHSGSSEGPTFNPSMTVIWIAITAAVIIYGLIGVFVRTTNREISPNDSIGVLTLVLGVAAIGLTLGALVFVEKILGSNRKPDQNNESRYMTYGLIRWALGEAIGVFGLVLLVLGADLTAGLFFIAWSFLLLLFLKPSQRDMKRFLNKTGGGIY